RCNMATQHQYDDDQDGDDFIITMVPELRKRIRVAAAQNDLSMQEYIRSILEQAVPSEPGSLQERSGRLNRAAVDDLLRYREEIKRAHPNQVLEDSSELLYQAREERTRELEER